jgi:hypothetical protein
MRVSEQEDHHSPGAADLGHKKCADSRRISRNESDDFDRLSEEVKVDC